MVTPPFEFVLKADGHHGCFLKRKFPRGKAPEKKRHSSYRVMKHAWNFEVRDLMIRLPQPVQPLRGHS
ncbi:MAG: hypothetical protein KJ905_03930 [Nanoarchaeota archaeon]|nr:hypothetical protein [Nanoarchaeota archaeon]MBU1501890.1 hypothetical protein [Nanoarchaeota archaeon]MBU2458810.1 hypothetical protein [Nanoarchaeota archaeon]